MKKFALTLMALLLAATLCGCSSDKKEDGSPAAKSGKTAAQKAENKEPEIVEGAKQIWSEEDPDIYYMPMTDGTVAIGCYADDENLIIPETVDGYRVSTLAKVENYARNMNQMVIPDTVVRILDDVFFCFAFFEEVRISPSHPTMKVQGDYLMSKEGKTLLAAVEERETYVIPEGVQRIGTGAFANRRDMHHVVFPESLMAIGDAAFVGTGLTEIRIPRTVTEIGINPFYVCEELTGIEVAQDNPVFAAIDGVLFRKEGKELLSYPSGREEVRYTIPDRILRIGDYAFYVTKLEEIIIPVSVTSIGMGAFSECYHLTEITIPNGVTSIGNYVFSGCGNLTSITLPNSVTTIGDYAFDNCWNLTSITLPNSVTRIGDYAFDNCWYLTDITIPDSVTTIGVNPFSDCDKLTEIIVSPDHPTLSVVNGSLIDKKNQRLICYLTALNEEHYDIPKGVREIGEYAFGGGELMSVSLPDSVTRIGDHAFVNCTALTSITLPNSVTSIGDYAFTGCTALTSISLSNSVTGIGECTFGYCTSLSQINIPDSVTSIDIAAFMGCQSLTSLFIPDSVTNIGGLAFLDCSSLTLTVNSGSYAQRYCEENGLQYTCPDALDWLYN